MQILSSDTVTVVQGTDGGLRDGGRFLAGLPISFIGSHNLLVWLNLWLRIVSVTLRPDVFSGTITYCSKVVSVKAFLPYSSSSKDAYSNGILT